MRKKIRFTIPVIAAGVLIAILATVALLTTAGGNDPEALVADSISAGAQPAGAGFVGSGSGSSFSETINITNESRYPLEFVGINTKDMGRVTSTPKQKLDPDGDGDIDNTDTITYESDNAGGGYVDITYLISGTTLTFDALFQVPTIGDNEAACRQSSFVNFDACSIDHGYHPTATWDITGTADGPFFDLGYQGEEWTFHKLGAPGSKGLQVNGASTDNGGAVALWDSIDQENYTWMWMPEGDGWGELINVNSRKCLELNSTTGQVDQWDCSGGANELWTPVWNPAGGSTLELQSTSQYLGTDVDPGNAVNGTTLTLSSNLDDRTSWAAINVD
jgi:hypothetical protein